jgi:hypothetical protein
MYRITYKLLIGSAWLIGQLRAVAEFVSGDVRMSEWSAVEEI